MKFQSNLDEGLDQDQRTGSANEELLEARKRALENFKQENDNSFDWLNKESRHFLQAGYLSPGVTAEERILEIAYRAEEILGIEGFAQKFFGYMSRGFYSLASPVWSNFGKERGLPISCFGSHISDDIGNILYTQSEVGMMSKLGGGTSGYFGKIRHRGAPIKNNGEASGAVHIMRLFESMVDVVSQGSVRRGRFSPYLPIDHPDIKEFLEIGTEGNPIQELTHGVTVTNEWMQEMIEGDTEKRTTWARVLQSRGEMGYPYVFFTDNANNKAADVYQDKKLPIYASNLCTEIMLPSNDRWSFVCVLSSINLYKYDEWKDTDAVQTMVYFLDSLITEFLEKLEAYRDSADLEDRQTFMFMEKAYNFDKEHRALGMGVLGWHSLLQSKRLAFDSQEAYNLNVEIFKTIKQRSYKASEELAEKFGEFLPSDGAGRAETMNWLFWQMGSAPILGGGFGHFYAYAPEKNEYPINRYAMEVKRQLDVLDRNLAEREYLAGDQYTIADMSVWPWYGALVKGLVYDAAEFLSVHEYTNVIRWTDQIAERPAVKRGRIVNRTWGDENNQLPERHDASDFQGKV